MQTNVKQFVPPDVLPVLSMIDQTWRQTGMIIPMAFIGGADGIGVLPMKFTTPESKDYYSRVIRELVQATDAHFVIFVAESWVLDIKDKSPEEASRIYSDWQAAGKSLSEHPLRREVIMLNYENRSGAKMGMLEIQTTDQGRTLSPIEWTTADPGEGRFTRFFRGAQS